MSGRSQFGLFIYFEACYSKLTNGVGRLAICRYLTKPDLTGRIKNVQGLIDALLFNHIVVGCNETSPISPETPNTRKAPNLGSQSVKKQTLIRAIFLNTSISIFLPMWEHTMNTCTQAVAVAEAVNVSHERLICPTSINANLDRYAALYAQIYVKTTNVMSMNRTYWRCL